MERIIQKKLTAFKRDRHLQAHFIENIIQQAIMLGKENWDRRANIVRGNLYKWSWIRLDLIKLFLLGTKNEMSRSKLVNESITLFIEHFEKLLIELDSEIPPLSLLSKAIMCEEELTDVDDYMEWKKLEKLTLKMSRKRLVPHYKDIDFKNADKYYDFWHECLDKILKLKKGEEWEVAKRDLAFIRPLKKFLVFLEQKIKD